LEGVNQKILLACGKESILDPSNLLKTLDPSRQIDITPETGPTELTFHNAKGEPVLIRGTGNGDPVGQHASMKITCREGHFSFLGTEDSLAAIRMGQRKIVSIYENWWRRIKVRAPRALPYLLLSAIEVVKHYGVKPENHDIFDLAVLTSYVSIDAISYRMFGGLSYTVDMGRMAPFFIAGGETASWGANHIAEEYDMPSYKEGNLGNILARVAGALAAAGTAVRTIEWRYGPGTWQAINERTLSTIARATEPKTVGRIVSSFFVSAASTLSTFVSGAVIIKPPDEYLKPRKSILDDFII